MVIQYGPVLLVFGNTWVTSSTTVTSTTQTTFQANVGITVSTTTSVTVVSQTGAAILPPVPATYGGKSTGKRRALIERTAVKKAVDITLDKCLLPSQWAGAEPSGKPVRRGLDGHVQLRFMWRMCLCLCQTEMDT